MIEKPLLMIRSTKCLQTRYSKNFKHTSLTIKIPFCGRETQYDDPFIEGSTLV